METEYKKIDKNISHTLLDLMIAFLLFSLTASSHFPTQPFHEWQKVIVNQEYKGPLVLDENDNNTIIVGAVFHDFTGDAITLGNVSNVYIKNCTIYNIDGNGIVLRSSKGTDRVTIDGCVIHDTTRNGIIAKQNIDEGIDHTRLVIKNNKLYKNGTDELDHSLYIQAQDANIQNNEITGSTGNGISIRSSGIVSGNKIRDTTKSCIRYFSDNVKGPSDTLLLENNTCLLSQPGSESPAFSLLLSDDSPPNWIVDQFIIRFNTIAVFTGQRDGIAVESDALRTKNIMVYGNIVINTKDALSTISNQYIDYYSSNYVSTDFLGFKDLKHPPYDLHLTPWSPAIGYANRETKFPVADADGHPRTAGHLDAGAYQLERTTSTTLVQSFAYSIEGLVLIGIIFLAGMGIKKWRESQSHQKEDSKTKMAHPNEWMSHFCFTFGYLAPRCWNTAITVRNRISMSNSRLARSI
ncbi:MAG: right-handed parallel beta-helix repeat-containing protein [Anaerolineales bacterium]